MDLTITISDFGSSGEDVDVLACTLAEFAHNNAEDQVAIELVGALAVGASVRLGGGAAPVFEVRRTA